MDILTAAMNLIAAVLGIILVIANWRIPRTAALPNGGTLVSPASLALQGTISNSSNKVPHSRESEVYAHFQRKIGIAKGMMMSALTPGLLALALYLRDGIVE